MPPTRPTSRSRADSPSWAFRTRRFPHLVEFDERFRLRAAPVAAAIRSGPIFQACSRSQIAAVAGSTSTGSIDLVDEARRPRPGREGLWLHVDAAYGGAARLSSRDAHRMPALERADSVTIDPHKWFFQAYDVGALLVREGGLLGADLLPHDPSITGAVGQGGGLDFSTAWASRAPAAGARSSYG